MLPVEDDRQLANQEQLREKQEQHQQALQAEKDIILLVTPAL